jgi:hypothetical protein
MARERGALESMLLVLALEALKKVGGGFGGELIVAKTDTDGATCEVKAVHLFKSFTSLIWITESRTALAR